MGNALSLLLEPWRFGRRRRKRSFDFIHLEVLKQGTVFVLESEGENQGQQVLVTVSNDGLKLRWASLGEEKKEWGSLMLSTLAVIEATEGREVSICVSRQGEVLRLTSTDEASKGTFLLSFNAYLQYRKKKLNQEVTFRSEDEESPRLFPSPRSVSKKASRFSLSHSLSVRSPLVKSAGGGAKASGSAVALPVSPVTPAPPMSGEDAIIDVDKLPLFEKWKWKRETEASRAKEESRKKKRGMSVEVPFQVKDMPLTRSPAM